MKHKARLENYISYCEHLDILMLPNWDFKGDSKKHFVSLIEEKQQIRVSENEIKFEGNA